MAVTRISELQGLTVPTADDLLIINDGATSTNKIKFSDFQSKLTSDLEDEDLTFTGSIELSGSTTISDVLSVTGDVTFTGTVDGIDLDELGDVEITSPQNGYVLTWVSNDNRWEARAAGVEPGVVVDSVNGQVGTVILDSDDIDDAGAAHRFVTFGEKTAIGTAVQPGENVSVLTNDANYLPSGANISELVNDAGYVTSVTSDVQSVNGQGGNVILDPDDLDDTSTDHKFATSVQLGLSETAVQPTDGINVLADVDTSLPGGPEVGQTLQWDGSNWTPAFGPVIQWEVDNQSSSAYKFIGVGFDGDELNPDIVVYRGMTYRFKRGNNHPFAIQLDSGVDGNLYPDGVTNNEVTNGVLVWEVRMDAPDNLFYQCRAHAAMVGNIIVR